MVEPQLSKLANCLPIDPDAIVIVEVFSKKSRQTPQAVMGTCKRRLQEYDNA